MLSMYVAIFLIGLSLHNLARTTEGTGRVTPQTLSLSPNSGLPGSEVWASGSGYDACNDSVTLLWDGVVDLGVRTVAGGSFSGVVTVPPDAQLGSHTVSTVCAGRPEVLGTADFEVTSSLLLISVQEQEPPPTETEPPPVQVPTLSLSPTSGAPGTEVTASGSGHERCSDDKSEVISVTLRWDNTIDLGTFTGTDGSFSAPITVPPKATPGSHKVSSTCTGSTTALAAATFQVTTVPTLSLSPTSAHPAPESSPAAAATSAVATTSPR
jgi:hypothetical protein